MKIDFTIAAILAVVCVVLAALCSPYVSNSSAWRMLCSEHLRNFQLPQLPGTRPFQTLCDTLQLTGELDSCEGEGDEESRRCRYGQVEQLTREILPDLQALVQSAYFRYFKVALYCDCPLWPDDGMCALEACSVCECDEHEVPPAWREEDAAGCQSMLTQAEQESRVNYTLKPDVDRSLHALAGWKGLNNPWLPELDEHVEFSYINLLSNPERFTGYAGEHAHRIWSAIYSQNCFRDIHSDTCDVESKVFYRIISGVHASISAHIAKEYLDIATGTWAPNLDVFRERFARPQVCDHVENLHFVYLFVLKAVAKAAPALRDVHFTTGMASEDTLTRALIERVVHNDALQTACTLPFDLGRMWRGEGGPELRSQLQQHFRNITSVMDCVGCEKCKLWGKLQFLGVATALKVLFASNSCDERALTSLELLQALQLERNEVIALVNLLVKLAESVVLYRDMSDQLLRDEGLQPCHRVADAIR